MEIPKIFESVIKIDGKFFRKGVDKEYESMYNLAEKLAVHEMQLYKSNEASKLFKKGEHKKDDFLDKFLDKIYTYRQKRIQHHINEMKELLKLREDIKENKRK